jgi:hypothetical protein
MYKVALASFLAAAVAASLIYGVHVLLVSKPLNILVSIDFSGSQTLGYSESLNYHPLNAKAAVEWCVQRV